MKKRFYSIFASILLLCSCTTKSNESSDSVQTTQTGEKEEDNSSLSNIEINGGMNKTHFDQEYRIYINPSVQYANTYCYGNTNEGYQMYILANLVSEKLAEQTNLIIHGNFAYPGLSLSNSLKESNSLNVDAHIALHSNGGGGKGSEAYYKTNAGKTFSESILNSLNEVLPYSTRGVKYTTSLYETNTSKAKAASLVEILFHDEKNQAIFIIENQETIAQALCEGIIQYFLEL